MYIMILTDLNIIKDFIKAAPDRYDPKADSIVYAKHTESIVSELFDAEMKYDKVIVINEHGTVKKFFKDYFDGSESAIWKYTDVM